MTTRITNRLLLLASISLLFYHIACNQISTNDLATDDAIRTVSSSKSPCESSDPLYDYSLKISEDVQFFWNVNGSSLNVSLRYNGIGWVGFGITDSSGSMIG